MISTASSSRPNWAKIGVSTPAIWLSFIALSFDPIRPFGCGGADRENISQRVWGSISLG
jgi:hypothetical protein